MKKLFVLSLAVLTVLTLSVTAFAATATDSAPASNAVKATYTPGATVGTKIYSVDVTFGDMNFTYTDTATGIWDPETHTYPEAQEAAWNKTTADITVKNHSNAAVDVSVSYAKDAGYTGDVNGSISEETFELATAENTEVEQAPSKTVTLTISGVPTNGVNNTTIGTVTVSIAAAQ